MEDLIIPLLVSLAVSIISAKSLSNTKNDATGTIIGVKYLIFFCSTFAAAILSASIFVSFLGIPFKDTKIYFALSMFFFICLYVFIIVKLFGNKDKGD